MKNIPLSVLLVAVVVAALVGAVTTSLIAESTEGAKSPVEPLLPVAANLPAEVHDQLQALRDENRELLQRVMALERRPEPIQTEAFPPKDAVTREELAALAEKVARWMPGWPKDQSGFEGPGDPGEFDPEAIAPSPAFTAAVERTLRTIRRRESAESWRRGAQKKQEHLDSRLGVLRQELDLSNYQVDELCTAFTANHERRLELIRLWEEGETTSEQLGEIKRANHQQHQQVLANILTAEQLELHLSVEDSWEK